MNKKPLDILFMAVSLVFAVAGIVFVLISMFGGNGTDWALPAGLLCVCLGNLFNLIRMVTNRNKPE